MQFQRQPSGILAQRIRGASAVELAILLAAVAGMMLLAVEVVGLSTRNVYDSLARAPGFAAREKLLPPADLQRPQAAASRPPNLLLPTTAVALLALSLWMLRRRRQPLLQTSSPTEPASELPGEGLVARRQEILASLTADWRSLFEDRLTVGQLAARQFRTIKPTMPLAQILCEVRAEASPWLLVCDERGSLLGAIGARELRAAGGTAQDVMDRRPLTAAASAPLSPVITAMLERKVAGVAVVEGSVVQGLLTFQDVMIAFQGTLRLLHRFAGGYDLGSLAAQHPSRTISGLRNANPPRMPNDPSICADDGPPLASPAMRS